MIPLARDPTGAITGLLYDMNSDIAAPPPVVRTSGKALELVSH